jgi:type IV pilus assembly protein PilV
MKQMAMRRTQGGALMMEILITIVVVVIGTLGLVEMQGRLQKSEMESYQRTQAMILLNDMASRISANRANAASYDRSAESTAFYGGLSSELTCSSLVASPATLQGNDAAQWCQALQGAGETQAGTSVGAMIGGRGCVEPNGADQFMVTVVWQGTTPIAAPPANVTCGANLYNVAGTDCINDLCRRYVTTLVSIARLDT